MLKNIILLPRGFTLENYSYLFNDNIITSAFLISIIRTVGGTIWYVIITGLAAYAVTRNKLPYKRAITIFLIIPMYVSGGLIPTFVLISKLHLFNNLLVYIIPYGFGVFNMLLMRTYFETIPSSLEESAKLDGASDLKVLIKIMLPLSMPIISVIGIYVGVWQWNQWFDALLYMTKTHLKPLQSVLQRLLTEALATVMEAQSGRVSQRTISPTSIQMATLMVTTIPIVCIYPFFQKYFIKGVMIGAVKA